MYEAQTMKFLDQILGLAKDQFKREHKKDLFSEIVGYEDLKDAFYTFIESNESANVLITGPPASAKSLFLMSIRDNLKNTYYIPAENATSAGLQEQLFGNKKGTKILLLDEIDKLPKSAMNTLLNFFETGLLQSTKVTRQKIKQFDGLKVFVTCNDITRLSKPLLSRFFRIHMKEYTEKEFMKIAVGLYPHKDPQLTKYVAKKVWGPLESKDIREFIQIMKHTKNSDDADKLIKLRLRYSEPKDDEEE